MLLIDYLPNVQTINAEYESSLPVQLKDIWKENATGRSTTWSCSCSVSIAVSNQKKLAYLGFHCLDYPTNYPELAPSLYELIPELKNKNSNLAVFVRHGCYCCRGNLIGRIKF
jgi:hypothetical protein